MHFIVKLFKVDPTLPPIERVIVRGDVLAAVRAAVNQVQHRNATLGIPTGMCSGWELSMQCQHGDWIVVATGDATTPQAE